MLRLAIVFIILAAIRTPAAEAAEAATPAPYSATYAVSYRGINAGLLHFELRPGEPGQFIYETRADPVLLARIIVSRKAVERSVLRIDGDGVRPLFWALDDGRSGNEHDGALAFAWDEGRVSGTFEGEAVELPAEPGLQDRLSIQIAVMTALLRGREPGTIPLVAEDQIKRYSYTRAGSERIRTRAGEFETVLYESTRPGSSRLSRIWHAPALGYVPVRGEQVRKGKVETVMELVKVDRGGNGR